MKPCKHCRGTGVWEPDHPSEYDDDAPEQPEYTPEAFLVATRRWWAQDRARRIRQGACPACGEKLCPKVGGRDAACVP